MLLDVGVDITYTTPLTLFPLFEDGVVENVDSSNLDQQNITIAHEIRKLFLVWGTGTGIVSGLYV